MRHLRKCFGLAALVLAAAPLSASADAQELPARRGGLWELYTTMDDGSGRRDQKLKICIDDTMERTTVASSIAEHKANCKSYEIEKAEGVTTVDAECEFNKANVRSHTVMSGDFQMAFKVRIESSTWRSGDDAGQTRIVKRTIEQTGTYAGPSCGELQPGEAAGTDGQKVLVQ